MRNHMTRNLLLAAWAAGASHTLLGQMLYVANNTERTLSTYVYNQDTGALFEIRPRVATTGTPSSVATHPNGKLAFVTTQGPPALNGFSIDPGSGKLTQVSSSTLANGSAPQQVAIDPSGKFVAVAHPGAPNVSVFSVDAATGATAPVTGSPFATPPQPSAVAIHPNGFVYVAANGTPAQGTPSQIVAFNLNSAGTAVAGSPFAGKNGVQGMVIDPAGKFLYVVERQDPGVLAYSIDATTGALTPVPGSPFLIANSFLTGIAVDPAGKNVYISNGGGVIHRFTIGSNGALTQSAFTPAPFGASAVVFDPKGRFLYVPCGTTVPTLTTFPSIASYSVDANTGALTRIGDLLAVGENTGPQRGATVLLDPPVLPPISVDSITNFYSHAPQGMPNSAIAQGSRMALYGSNIGPAAEVPIDSTVKPELGGVSVEIRSGDVTTKALIVDVSSRLVTCIVPSSTPLGDAAVTLTYNGRAAAPVPVTIVRTSVGIRSKGHARDTGAGPSLSWNVPLDAQIRLDQSLIQIPNALNQSARPGQVVVVQGTGLGPVTGDETSLQLLQEVDTPAEVIVGNKTVPAILNARGGLGQDFIGFKLPDDVLQGCYVPIAVRAGGYTSNVASISVSANGGSCSDPHGFAASDIDVAQRSGGLNMGVIEISDLGFGDQAEGRFVRYAATDLTSSFAPGGVESGVRSVFALPPLGSCTVTPGSPADGFDIPGDPTPAQRLNAGPALNLSGPGGRAQLAAPVYRFDSDGADVFKPGDYTVDNGTGTQAVGPFRGAITLPPPVKWTNQDAISSPDRSQDLTITWTGGATDKEFVMIAGLAQSEKVTAAFLCTERVTAGTFTVPAWVLAKLPASAPVMDGGETLPGGLMIVATAPLTSVGRFTATGLDFGLFTYEQGAFNLVSFR